MHSPGDLVVADYEGQDQHGLIVKVFDNNTFLLITREGCLYVCYLYGAMGPGEKTPFGQVRFTEEVDDLHASVQKLLLSRAVQRAVRIATRQIVAAQEAGRKGVLEAWEMPLRPTAGYGSDLSNQFVRYMMAPRRGRKREEGILKLLKGNAPKQYRVIIACWYGSTQQATVAATWGCSRSAISQLLTHGLKFLEDWGIDTTEGNDDTDHFAY